MYDPEYMAYKSRAEEILPLQHHAAMAWGWKRVEGHAELLWRSPNGNLYRATGHYEPEFERIEL